MVFIFCLWYLFSWCCGLRFASCCLGVLVVLTIIYLLLLEDKLLTFEYGGVR